MNTTSIHRFIDTYFDENELRTLCADLGVDYDNLPVQGKSSKARELVGYLQRRNRLSELVNYITHERPNVSLEEFEKKVFASADYWTPVTITPITNNANKPSFISLLTTNVYILPILALTTVLMLIIFFIISPIRPSNDQSSGSPTQNVATSSTPIFPGDSTPRTDTPENQKPITTPILNPTPIITAATPQNNIHQNIMRISPVMRGCGYPSVLPYDIAPSQDPSGSYKEFKDRLPFYVGITPFQEGTFRFIYNLSSFSTNFEAIKLDNKITITITSTTNISDSLDAAFACQGGGEIRYFPPVSLEARNNTRKVEIKYREYSFFRLPPGDMEELGVQLNCDSPDSPGLYQISLELIYWYGGMKQSVILTDKPITLFCPRNVVVWGPNYETVEEKFIRSYSLKWTNTGYQRGP